MGKDITLKLGVGNRLRGDLASTGCILEEPSGTLGSTDGDPGSRQEEGESIGNVRRSLGLPMCTKIPRMLSGASRCGLGITLRGMKRLEEGPF